MVGFGSQLLPPYPLAQTLQSCALSQLLGQVLQSLPDQWLVQEVHVAGPTLSSQVP